MKKKLSAAVCLACSATAFLALPGTSEAQIFRRLFNGRGANAAPSNSGTNQYGYRTGLLGRNRGVVAGTSPNYANNGNAVQPGTAPVQPNTAPPSDPQPNAAPPNVSQSFYPPQAGSFAASAGLPAPTDGRGRIVLNVPANADVSWNGSRSASLGSTRSYLTLPLTAEGAIQKFEARWTGSNGQPVSQTREVRAMPNATATLDFLQPEATEKAPAAK